MLNLVLLAALALAEPVVIAKKEVLPGTTLSGGHLTMADLKRVGGDEAWFDNKKVLVGRVTVERLIPGEPVRAERLAPEGAPKGLDALIPEDLGPVDIEVGAANATGIVSGNSVEVHRTTGSETTLAYRSLKVLTSDAKKGVITVLATPADVELLGAEGPWTVAVLNQVDAAYLQGHGEPWEGERERGAGAVAAASRDLHPGINISEGDLALLEITGWEGAIQQRLVLGKVPAERILTHEPVRVERLADPTTGHGMSALVPQGQRAITVEIDADLPSKVAAGAFVDLYSGDEQVLEAVHVVATPGRGLVSLAVRLGQAEKVAHAAQSGDSSIKITPANRLR